MPESMVYSKRLRHLNLAETLLLRKTSKLIIQSLFGKGEALSTEENAMIHQAIFGSDIIQKLRHEPCICPSWIQSLALHAFLKPCQKRSLGIGPEGSSEYCRVWTQPCHLQINILSNRKQMKKDSFNLFLI